MNKEELRKAQLCQLKIAEEVKRICDKHEIPYFLAYGTMLGAVRHKGFIPWDDDLDIGLLRKDYDRFVEVCKTELDEKFFLQTFDTDPFYVWPFAKMLLNDTVYRERWDSPKTKNGVYIDIFPMDGAPASDFRRRLNKIRYRSFVRMLQIKIGMTGFLEHGFVKRLMWYTLFVGSKLFSIKFLQKELDKILRDGNKDRSGYIYNLNSPYSLKKEIIEKTVFSRFIEVPFEGVNFKIVKKYDYYLKHYYNDYMQLPPEDQRENRHQIEEFVLPEWLEKELDI